MTSSAQGAYKVGGRFPLGECIERRAVGDVFAATDETNGAPVTVLLVSPHIFSDPAAKDRRLGEIRAVAASTHPNLVRIVDVGTIEDGRIYVACERVDGLSLANQVATGPVPAGQSVSLFTQVIDALEEGKRLGVWHRDLSPQNVVLSRDLSVARLQYFGLAEPAGNGVFGNPWFLSPEGARGEAPSEASTVYGVGALWYYAVCGAPVFPDADPAVVLSKQQNEVPPPASRRRPEVSRVAGLDDFLAKALAKTPGERFGTLAEMRAAASALLSGVAAAMEASAPTIMAPAGVAGGPAPAPQAAPVSAAAPGAAAAPVAPATPQAAPVSAAASGAAAAPEAPATPQAAPVSAAAPGAAAAPEAPAAPHASEASHGPAAPGAAAASQPAAGQPSPRASAGRRRKKKGFRETLWFMKGELQAEAAAVDEKDLAEIQAGDGSIDDREKELDERYRDDGSVDAEAHRKYSVKTGQTGMMPAVVMPGPMEAAGVADIEKRRAILLWVVIILVLLGGGGGAVAYLLMRPPKTFVKGDVVTTVKAQVSDYAVKAERKVLVAPPLRNLPEGSDQELWKKLQEHSKKPDAFLPKDGVGLLDTLAALEKRRAAIAHENESLPRHKRRSLFWRIDRRRAWKVKKEYAKLRKNTLQAVRQILDGALKSEKDKDLTQAKAACMLVMPYFDLGKDKGEFADRCKKVDLFFGGGEDEEGDARARPEPRRRATTTRPRARTTPRVRARRAPRPPVRR